jgi:hypothetical protein
MIFFVEPALSQNEQAIAHSAASQDRQISKRNKNNILASCNLRKVNLPTSELSVRFTVWDIIFRRQCAKKVNHIFAPLVKQTAVKALGRVLIRLSCIQRCDCSRLWLRLRLTIVGSIICTQKMMWKYLGSPIWCGSIFGRLGRLGHIFFNITLMYALNWSHFVLIVIMLCLWCEHSLMWCQSIYGWCMHIKDTQWKHVEKWRRATSLQPPRI